MKITLGEHQLTIVRDDGRKYYSESVFLHNIKLALKAQGYDVIKKEMVKDGHMVSEGVYYLRERKWNFTIWDTNYAIRPTYQPYNLDGEVTLTVSRPLS